MSQHIACIPTGVHAGSRRYPDRYDSPRMKVWRCELTALSQLYNIYFLACNDTIHVYRPSFPDQNISNEPDLILYPPVSAQIDSELGVDPQDPHSVNRLVVDYLGHEEILLAACDDGDVVGYRVKEIQRALDAQVSSMDIESEVMNENDIKVFLHQNVGASAWGLAVHREARIIAISANTHQITVLAYALVHPTDLEADSNVPTNMELDESSSQKHELPTFRRREHTFTLKAHTNIPAVSFNNNGDDPAGRWLFSSSIDGKTIIWDLHNPGRLTGVIQVGWCASTISPTQAPTARPGQCSCHDRGQVIHAAWGAFLLDTRSAYELRSTDESSLGRQTISPCFTDVTESKKEFTIKINTAHIHPPIDIWGPLSGDEDEDLSDMAMSLYEEDDEDSDAESSAHLQQIDTANTENNTDFDNQLSSEEEMIGTFLNEFNESLSPGTSLFIPETTTASVTTETDNSPVISLQPQSQPLPPFYTDTAAPWVDESASDTESNDSDGMFTLAQLQAHIAGARIPWTQPKKTPYCEMTSNPKNVDLPNGATTSPCLIITREEIYLVQRPFSPLTNASTDSIITMRRPLHPGLWSPLLKTHDRLCYFTQIPELGAFVVASPCGLAGVFSLYWSRRRGEISPHYGFKLEYLLPYEKDKDREASNLSESRLVGIAVAPVQGMFDTPMDAEGAAERNTPQTRRWRLLMYYTDHTVLSFELSKKRLTDSPDLSDLVV